MLLQLRVSVHYDHCRDSQFQRRRTGTAYFFDLSQTFRVPVLLLPTLLSIQLEQFIIGSIARSPLSGTRLSKRYFTSEVTGRIKLWLHRISQHQYSKSLGSILFSRRKQCDGDGDTAYPSLFIMLLIKSNIEFLSTTCCSTMVSSYQSTPSYVVALASLASAYHIWYL
jgi:hypothetical protein